MKNMKKYIILAIFALGFGMNVNAQVGQYRQSGSDAFFSTSSCTEYRETTDEWGTMPLLPIYGSDTDHNADPTPIGSGLLLLAGMGLGYAAMTRKRQK